jgi:predicted DNA-binding ribbon-helix-helix protein
MKSSVAKHSVVLAGHKTSISLEDEFWRALKDIASSRRTTPMDLINSIHTDREHGNLSSATRLFVLNHYKTGAASHPSDSRPRAIIAHASHQTDHPRHLCAVLQRNDLFGLYISPMAPLFPPEFATASSISGIQIARAMTVISPSSYHHRRKCRLNMRIHCSPPVGLACRQARISL